MTDYTQILEKLRPGIHETANFIHTEFQTFDIQHLEKKGHNDLVSYVDRKAEEILMNYCKKIIPEAGFINEETGIQNPDNEFVWVIDPLDGTTNFIQKIPFFAISLALLENGKPVLGVVFEINRKEEFYAIKGHGSFCNGQQLILESSEMKDVVLATGFPYSNFINLDAYMGLMREMMLNSRGIRRLGSAALDLAYTASGRFGGFFEGGLNPWDVAAGVLIVQEAGGHVTDFQGGEDYIFGKSILAGVPGVFPKMTEIVTRHAFQDLNK